MKTATRARKSPEKPQSGIFARYKELPERGCTPSQRYGSWRYKTVWEVIRIANAYIKANDIRDEQELKERDPRLWKKICVEKKKGHFLEYPWMDREFIRAYAQLTIREGDIRTGEELAAADQELFRVLKSQRIEVTFSGQ